MHTWQALRTAYDQLAVGSKRRALKTAEYVDKILIIKAFHDPDRKEHEKGDRIATFKSQALRLHAAIAGKRNDPEAERVFLNSALAYVPTLERNDIEEAQQLCSQAARFFGREFKKSELPKDAAKAIELLEKAVELHERNGGDDTDKILMRWYQALSRLLKEVDEGRARKYKNLA